MIRTFLDSNVLIAACRNDRPNSERAQRVIEDPRRIFLTSVFVRLETVPQVSYHRYAKQRAYVNEFFNSATEWASDLNLIVQLGLSEAERHGLGAMDSLHIAAAMALRANQFITAEKTHKPMFRVRNLNLICLDDV